MQLPKPPDNPSATEITLSDAPTNISSDPSIHDDDVTSMSFVIDCVRVEIGVGDVEIVRSVMTKRELDWDKVIALAGANGVLSLVSRALLNNCSAQLENDVVLRLQEHQRVTAGRSLIWTRELLRIVAGFRDAGIGVAAFKGPTLSMQAYGGVDARIYYDIDVIVAPSDVRSADTELRKIGYVQEAANEYADNALVVRYLHEQRYNSNVSGSTVELHWRLSPRYFALPVSTDQMLAHMDFVDIGGVDIPTLQFVDNILALSVHAARHMFSRLIWITDVAALLSKCDDEQISLLLRRANELGVLRVLTVTIVLAQRLLKIALPKTLSEAFQPDATSIRLVERTIGWVTHTEQRPTGRLENIPIALYHLRTRERVSDKVRYIIYLTFTPSDDDFRAYRLPKALWFMYVVMRPGRLMLKYAWFAIVTVFSKRA